MVQLAEMSSSCPRVRSNLQFLFRISLLDDQRGILDERFAVWRRPLWSFARVLRFVFDYALEDVDCVHDGERRTSKIWLWTLQFNL